jgi:hypothetical protein
MTTTQINRTAMVVAALAVAGRVALLFMSGDYHAARAALGFVVLAAAFVGIWSKK